MPVLSYLQRTRRCSGGAAVAVLVPLQVIIGLDACWFARRAAAHDSPRTLFSLVVVRVMRPRQHRLSAVLKPHRRPSHRPVVAKAEAERLCYVQNMKLMRKNSIKKHVEKDGKREVVENSARTTFEHSCGVHLTRLLCGRQHYHGTTSCKATMSTK